MVAEIGTTSSAARLWAESGDDILSMPWLRANLSSLKKDLEAAALSTTGQIGRLHYTEMAVQVGRLFKVGMS